MRNYSTAPAPASAPSTATATTTATFTVSVHAVPCRALSCRVVFTWLRCRHFSRYSINLIPFCISPPETETETKTAAETARMAMRCTELFLLSRPGISHVFLFILYLNDFQLARANYSTVCTLAKVSNVSGEMRNVKKGKRPNTATTATKKGQSQN